MGIRSAHPFEQLSAHELVTDLASFLRVEILVRLISRNTYSLEASRRARNSLVSLHSGQPSPPASLWPISKKNSRS